MDDNYYIILNLDPNVDDWGLIEPHILIKQREWASTTCPQKEKAFRRIALKKIKDIKAALQNPESRRKHAAEAKKIINDQRRAALKELDVILQLARLKLYYTQSDINRTIKHLSGALLEAEIRAEFVRAGLIEETVTKKTKTAHIGLDKTVEDRLFPALDALVLKDVYELLSGDRGGLSSSSSPHLLFSRVKEIQDDLRRKPHTDERTIKEAILGECDLFFRSDAEKKKYDNSQAFRKMLDMRELLGIAAGESGVISFGAYNHLVDQAVARGVPRDLAHEYLVIAASDRNWHVVTGEPGKAPPFTTRCGFCGTLGRPGDRNCSNCGEALGTQCPKCKAVVTTEIAACPACGFLVGDWPWVKGTLDHLRQLLEAKKIEDAEADLVELRSQWGAWPEVQTLTDEAARLRRDRDTAEQKLAECVRTRQLTEARRLVGVFLSTWGREADEGQRREIERGLKQAEKACVEGQIKLKNNAVADAIALYRSALAECIDYEPAKRALAAVPLPVPTDLTMTLDGNGYLLEWNGAGSLADGYSVVRKSRGAPSSDRDGDWFLQVTDTVASDPDVPAGTPWHYAVYSRLGGKCSQSAARSGPHLRVAKVEGLTARVGDREVVLSWAMPPGATTVKVWRRDGRAPSRPGDGVEVTSSTTSLHDGGLVNDATYGYLVIPLYPDPTRPGGSVTGHSATCVAIPTAPPRPITDLVSSRNGELLTLRWTPPGNGVTTQLRQLKVATAVVAGTLLSTAEADAMGRSVAAMAEGMAQVRLAGVVEATFTVLACKGSALLMGNTVTASRIEPVVQARGDTDGHMIRLVWQWPSGADRVAVCYGLDSFPTSPDQEGVVRKDVTLYEYQRQGMFTLRNVEHRHHNLSLFVLSASGRGYSDPVHLEVVVGQLCQMAYRIVSERSGFFGPITYSLLVEGHGTLPACVLVAKHRVIPTRLTDGDEILRLDRTDLCGSLRKAVTHKPGYFCKLFFLNPANAKDIKLVSGSMDQLKLG